MNFGPLVPQEIEPMVAFLEKNSIPFEIHFNEQGAKEELEPSPGNNILYSELRTKAYLAQHFYIEVPEEFLINNPKVEGQILRFITKDHFEDKIRAENDNVVNNKMGPANLRNPIPRINALRNHLKPQKIVP